MKYFLSLEQKDSYPVGYKKIILKDIDAKLGTKLNGNNNLNKICMFTMQEESEFTLKRDLINKGILTEEDMFLRIFITYQINKKEQILEIPYKMHKKYFDLDSLVDILYKQILKNKKVLRELLNAFGSVRYYSDTYYYLKDMLEVNLGKNALYNNLYNFVYVYLVRNNKLNHLAMYRMAMFVSNNDFKNKESLFTIDKERLPEAEQYKLEEWMDNYYTRTLKKK